MGKKKKRSLSRSEIKSPADKPMYELRHSNAKPHVLM